MKADVGAGKSPRKILIVDDHPLTRRGMAQLISQEADLMVCGEAGDGERALAMIDSLKPHLVLIDVTLPRKPGLELIKEIRAQHSDILLLVVSMHDESLYAERALRAGARGYLMKNEGGDKLIEAIRHVLSGKIFLSESLSDQILDLFSSGRQRPNKTPMGSLTDREFEVFQFIGQGLTTREMSAQLHMSAKTVETHRLHIRAKLGLKSGPELIKYAVRWAGARDLI
jgi:DNA-binding NarL/FixJ family response regulator